MSSNGSCSTPRFPSPPRPISFTGSSAARSGIFATKASVDLVEHYLERLDWRIKENSNMCYSLQGLNNYISSDITSEYWLNRIYPPAIRDLHKRGRFSHP